MFAKVRHQKQSLYPWATLVSLVAMAITTACSNPSSQKAGETPEQQKTTQDVGGVDGGGGDLRAQEFVKIAKRIGTWSSETCTRAISCADGNLISAKAKEFEQSLSRADKPTVRFEPNSIVDSQGVLKMATYHRDTQTISVDGNAWYGLSQIAKYKLVALEMMGLLGISDRYSKVADFETHQFDLIKYSDNNHTFEFWYRHSRITKILAMFHEIPDLIGGGLSIDPPELGMKRNGFLVQERHTTVIFGESLYKWEKARVELFLEATKGLVSAHPSYLFDLYIGELTYHSEVSIDGSGAGSTTFSRFNFPSRLLAVQIYGYLQNIEHTLIALAESDEQRTIRASDKAILQKIVSKVKAAQLKAGFSDENNIQGPLKSMVPIFKPTFTTHLEYLVNKARMSVQKNKCQVPLIASFLRESAQELVSAAKPDARDFEVLKAQSRQSLDDVRTIVDEIDKDWTSFVDGGGIERIGRKVYGNSWWDNIGTDLQSIIRTLQWVYIGHLNDFSGVADTDEKILQNLIKKIDDGSLCLKVGE